MVDAGALFNEQLSVSVPPEQVERYADLLSAALAQHYPDVAFDSGAIRDLLVSPAAWFLARQRQVLDDFLRWTSLGQLATADNVPEEFLDYVAENFRLKRTSGSKARGTVQIVLSSQALLTIPQGTIFAAGPLKFVTLQTYASKLSSATVQFSGDRPLKPYGDGSRYYFLIEVEAEQEGSQYNLRQGQELTLLSPLPFVVAVFAYSQFEGGADVESAQQLVDRARIGWSSSTMSNRSTMESLLRTIYPQAVSSSIIGYGDAEMLRDKHSVLPVAFGGRVDWYIQTRLLPSRRIVDDKEATLIEKQGQRGVWQFTFDRDEAAGVYDIEFVRPAGSANFVGSLEILEDRRRVDLSPIYGELLPDITDSMEAVYSRFQTITVRFVDPQTPASDQVGSSKPYQVAVRLMPDIAQLQSVLAARSYRHVGGDILVKAPIPCFTKLSFTLFTRPSSVVPDVGVIKSALVDLVNRMGFTGYLDSSILIQELYKFLGKEIIIGDLDMVGHLLLPSGRVQALRSTSTLQIPYLASEMATGRTALFVLYPEDISVSLALRLQ